MKKTFLALVCAATLYGSAQHTATVLQTINAAGYTYVEVKEGNKTYWVAMTQRRLKKGDTISYNEQGWMKNFHSKTLNRDFDTILFASDATASPNQVQPRQERKPDILHSRYQTKGTITIAEAFKNRDKYAGKKVSIRAKVTKVSKDIMKRNWVHVEDGSRYANMDDLVFTTTHKTPQVGEVVTATGTLQKDKDFGYGYFYPVIVEHGSFKK